MQVQVDEYPCWYVFLRPYIKDVPLRLGLKDTRDGFWANRFSYRGDQIHIDTWVGGSGRNGMRRDWMIKTPTVARFSLEQQGCGGNTYSTWAMVNQKTQGAWKMRDEIKEEISHSFIPKQAIKEDFPKKIDKLNANARYVISGLQVKTISHHRDSVFPNLFEAYMDVLGYESPRRKMTYVGWMLEAIPDECWKNYVLSDIILEFQRECRISDIVQSLCEPEEVGINEDGLSNEGSIEYTHLLHVEGKLKCEEMVRGKTISKKRLNQPKSSGF